jgi:hypothetical protein
MITLTSLVVVVLCVPVMATTGQPVVPLVVFPEVLVMPDAVLVLVIIAMVMPVIDRVIITATVQV